MSDSGSALYAWTLANIVISGDLKIHRCYNVLFGIAFRAAAAAAAAAALAADQQG